MNQVKINSLQSLRALAFLSVFMTHFFAKNYYTILSLSIFFILSGFILSIRYKDYDSKVNLKNSFLFGIRRIKKLYVLHIITMIIDIVLYIEVFKYNGIDFYGFIKFLIQIFTNILLVQSWIPIEEINVALNGVTWFLSVLLFLYIAFPLINKIFKNRNVKFYKITIIVLIVFLTFLENVGPLVMDVTSYPYLWFIYRNAFIRSIDFIIGYCLGRIYINQTNISRGCLVSTVEELLLTIFCIYLYKYSGTYRLSLPFFKIRNASYYVLISALWVYLFAIRNGLITKLLSNKFFNWIGDLSGYAFLIHYPVIQWGYFFISITPFNPIGYERYILFVAELCLTIFLSYMWSLFNNKLLIRNK